MTYILRINVYDNHWLCNYDYRVCYRLNLRDTNENRISFRRINFAVVVDQPQALQQTVIWAGRGLPRCSTHVLNSSNDAR